MMVGHFLTVDKNFAVGHYSLKRQSDAFVFGICRKLEITSVPSYAVVMVFPPQCFFKLHDVGNNHGNPVAVVEISGFSVLNVTTEKGPVGIKLVGSSAFFGIAVRSQQAAKSMMQQIRLVLQGRNKCCMK